MNLLSVFVATLSVLAAFATALIVPLPVVLPRELDHVYALLQDPARTYLTVSTNSSQTSVVHMHSDRTFYIDVDADADADADTAVVEFILALHSLDVDFPAPQFALSMGRATLQGGAYTYALRQHVPALHEALQDKLPAVAGGSLQLDVSLLGLDVAQWERAHVPPGGILNLHLENVPGMVWVFSHKWKVGLFFTLILIALLPMLLIRIDSDFAERVVQQQLEKKREMQERDKAQ